MKELATSCPHCGNPTSYRPGNAGNKTNCQKCLKEFRYPIEPTEVLARINDQLYDILVMLFIVMLWTIGLPILVFLLNT